MQSNEEMDESMEGLAGQFEWLEGSQRERPLLDAGDAITSGGGGEKEISQNLKGEFAMKERLDELITTEKSVNRKREWLNKSHNYTNKQTRERERERIEEKIDSTTYSACFKQAVDSCGCP